MFDGLQEKFGYSGGGEFGSDEYFPYIDHIGSTVMLLSDNSVMSVIRMIGAPFSLIMNSQRNGGKKRLVAFLNGSADENVEIHIHLVKHDSALPPATYATPIEPYAKMFLKDYHDSIADDMAVVDWFVTIRVKPRKQPFDRIADKARDGLAKVGILSRRELLDPAVETQLADAVRLALAVLAPFGPTLLGTREERSLLNDEEPQLFSEIAEFLYLLRTVQFMAQPMADVCGFLGAGIAAVDVTKVPKTRLLRIDHAAGGSTASQSYAAVLGMTAYPKVLDQSRLDALMALPGRFVMTVAIKYENRAKMQDALQLLERRLISGGNRAADDISDLDDAISQLAGGKSESGLSRWSLVVHAGTQPETDSLVAAARNVITPAGAKVTTESQGRLISFLAQLPGAPLHTWIRPATCNNKQISVLATLGGHSRGPAKPRWGKHLFRMLSEAGTIYDHDLFVGDVGHNYVCGPNGGGKCLAKGTPVMMFDGTIVPVEEIRTGDLLMGPDSKPRQVVSLARGREEMFRITPKRGDSYTVNRSHILSLKTCSGSATNCRSLDPGTIVNLNIDEYLAMPKSWRNCAMGWRASVDFEPSSRLLPLPAYLLGVWLGDGSSWRSEVCTGDAEIKQYLQEYAASRGMTLLVRPGSGKSEICILMAGPTPKRGRGGRPSEMKITLQELDLIQNKHIPHSYKAASRQDRLELLAGVIDTDGHWSGKGFDLTLKSERLMDDVIFVARSLGFSAFKARCKKTCVNNGAVGQYFRCAINGAVETIPCKIARKKAPPRRINKNVLLTGIRSVESVGEDDYYGFTLDGPDRLFLLGDFTVTHNTVWVAANIIAMDAIVRVGGGTQIVFDVDESHYSTLAMLGARYSTMRIGHSGLAPLQLADSPRVRALIRDLITGLVQTDDNPPPTKAERDGMRAGVDFVMGELDPEHREFKIIRDYMGFEDGGAGDRLEPWCRDGEFGWVFDGDKNEIDFNYRLVGCDLTAIMNDTRIMPPVALVVLWMASDVMDGRRVVVQCEEAQSYMPTPAFARPFKGIALRGRKRNTSFNAITQQPSDMRSNEAGTALVKQARQMVLFRNDNPVEDDYINFLGCTPAQYRQISAGMFALPHHSVLIKRQDGLSALNRFDLSSMPQHLNVLAGTPTRVKLMKDCLRKSKGDEMAAFAAFQSRILETAA